MDLRIHHIFNTHMSGDKSFQEKDHPLSILFGTNKYSKQEMKETWNRGIRHGIELGLREASLDGQLISLRENTTDERHKEFINKFTQLANEYQCAIQHHPKLGMVIVDTKNEFV